MLTKKLYQQVGLMKCIQGHVVELVFADDAPLPNLPLYVVVEFRGYSGGKWSSQERYRGCVPISPVDTTWHDGGTQVKTQQPLRLCWAKRHVGSIPPVVPLAITRTNGPWRHTSDDSYIYQLSLVSATAIVSFILSNLFFAPTSTIQVGRGKVLPEAITPAVGSVLIGCRLLRCSWHERVQPTNTIEPDSAMVTSRETH